MTDLDRAMQRYSAGESVAFDELFRALWPRIYGYLRRLCGSRELARDLAQEVFLKIHRRRGGFTRERRVEPWAFAIARNCFLSHARLRRSRLRRLCDQLDEGNVRSGPAHDPEQNAIACELQRLLDAELERASSANREAFRLLRVEGLSVADTADALGTTPGAIKLRTFRTAELLRAALDRAEREPTLCRALLRVA